MSVISRTAYMLPVALSIVAGCSPDQRAASGSVTYETLDAWTSSSDRELELLDRYCMECHNSVDFAGGVAFESLSLANLGHDAAIWEEVIRKIRAGLMPPQGQPRPERADLDGIVQWLGTGLDLAWDESPNPGAEPVARLNRTEYRNAVLDLLAFDAEDLVGTLPADATSSGFDNIAEVLSMSPTLLEGYLSVAMQISRQAVGDPATSPTQVEYQTDGGRSSQQAYVEGLPLGTRGGMVVEHYFPVDAEYEFNVAANIPVAGRDNDAGRMVWCGGPKLEVMFNGVPMPVENPERFRLQVPAGSHTISLAMLDERQCVGAGELLLGDANGSAGSIQGLEIDGPYNITGPGDTASRRAIFVCRPQPEADEACARRILSHLATRAYRRPIAAADPEVDTLMQFYERSRSAEDGDFESGIEAALTWLLVDPKFLYRFEAEPEGLAAGEIYRISDLELASRLSFFIWSSIPDERLLEFAAAGRLGEADLLAAEVERMLADPRAEALVENFAGQWLNLRQLAEAAPQDPAFDPALREAMRLETLLFFESLVHEDRDLIELLDSSYTYLNERLAAHYGIEGVWGEYMRRVELPDDSPRRGILGHGSLLTTTSVANRTSPVVRGTWIVENLLGAHVPSPPPGVETNLESEATGQDAPADTLRQRMELHRENPECAACHHIMDPIGFSLENFDLTGRWRALDNGLPIDTASEMVDGTSIDGPATLRAALLARRDGFKASISERLLTYALGRELEHYDGPAARRIIEQANAEGFTMAALVRAVVISDPFQQRIKPQ